VANMYRKGFDNVRSQWQADRIQ